MQALCKALALQKDTCHAGGQFIGYVAMAKHLTQALTFNDPTSPDLPDHPAQPGNTAPTVVAGFQVEAGQRGGFRCVKSCP